MALLNISDSIYNWLVDFFSDRKHSTTFQGLTSEKQDISASIIQGSAVGPVSYVINVSDLPTVTSSAYAQTSDNSSSSSSSSSTLHNLHNNNNNNYHHHHH